MKSVESDHELRLLAQTPTEFHQPDQDPAALIDLRSLETKQSFSLPPLTEQYPVTEMPQVKVNETRKLDRITRIKQLGAYITLVVSAALTGNLIPASTTQEARLLTDIVSRDAGNSHINPNFYTLDEGFKVLEANYGVSNGLFNDDDWFATAWKEAGAALALDLTSLTSGPSQTSANADFVATVDAVNTYYWDTTPIGYPAGFDQNVKFFMGRSAGRLVDDAAWLGNLNMAAYKKTGNFYNLQMAMNVVDLAISQRDKHGGGYYWMEQLPGTTNHTRGVVSNAPVARLCLEIYMSTGDKKYLKEAMSTYEWVYSHLLDKSNGLFYDHIKNNGEINRHIWSYNAGEMAGLTAALHQCAPDRYPLSKVKNITIDTLRYIELGKFDNDPIEFMVIAFSNLMYAAAVINQPALTNRIRRDVRNYAKHIYHKNPTSLLGVAGKEGTLDLEAISRDQVKDWKNLYYSTSKYWHSISRST